MIRSAVIVGTFALACVVACISDSYECTTDADCDFGVAGRCEVDHRCTQYDVSCTLTQRRYDEHSGSDTQVCYLGQVAIANPCAAGQPPADSSDPCGAAVCAALPTCCNAGWSEACVLEAQRSCAVTCDTRIAISAVRGAVTELWDLRYDGSNFTAAQVTDRQTQLDWIAPAPGSAEPRLASFLGSDTLALATSGGEQDIPVDPTRAYHDVTSVDLDRDQRDTIALEWEDPTTSDEEVEVMKVDAMTSRDFDVGVSNRAAWGDYDQDGYPDGVSGTGAKYAVLINMADDDQDRTLDGDMVSTSFTGSAKNGVTSLRSLEWRDADHDSVLDLAAFGNSIRLHEGGPGGLKLMPYLAFDCEPLVVLPNSTCDASLGNFAGTVVPTDTGSVIYAANTVTRTLYEIVPDGTSGAATITQLVPPIVIGNGVGSGVGEAVFTRDLDGDKILDVVVVDASLGLWVSLSTQDPTRTTFTYVHPIAPVDPPFGQVHVSVSGMPR